MGCDSVHREEVNTRCAMADGMHGESMLKGKSVTAVELQGGLVEAEVIGETSGSRRRRKGGIRSTKHCGRECVRGNYRVQDHFGVQRYSD